MMDSRSDVPRLPIAFALTVPKTYRDEGFFNVPREFADAAPKDGPISFTLGDLHIAAAGTVERRSQRNGTPRVHGDSRVKAWFKAQAVGSQVLVEFTGPTSIRLRRMDSDAPVVAPA